MYQKINQISLVLNIVLCLLNIIQSKLRIASYFQLQTFKRPTYNERPKGGKLKKLLLTIKSLIQLHRSVEIALVILQIYIILSSSSSTFSGKKA